jgi:hypothetical protein
MYFIRELIVARFGLCSMFVPSIKIEYQTKQKNSTRLRGMQAVNKKLPTQVLRMINS